MFGICTNKKQVICVSLIVFEVLILSLAFFSYANKDLESYVVGIETKLDKNMFKVMLEDSSGGYTESVDNTFPSYDYFFNPTKSGCIDGEGNKLDNSLVFDINTRKVSINVSKTSYCYLYFDKLKETNLASKLITDGNMWQSGLEGDGYRFVGSGVATSETSPDNFICFGTTDQTECKNNESKYLYRIIGVFQDSEGNEHVKLIKYKQIGSYTWNSANTNVSWETSNLYNGLNGTYFLTNTEYDYMQNADWTNKIANWKWTSTNTETRTKNGLYYNNVNPSIIYLHELNQNRPSTYQYYAYNSSTALYDILSTDDFTIGTWTYPNAKIGLMYGSDYALSLGNTAKNMVTSTNINKDILKTGWMHQSNNDTSKHADEYTLSRSGIVDDSWWCAWYVSSNGYINDRGIYQNSATRPVFYLESNVGYQSGTGDYIDPIIIGEENRINATNDGANVIATVSTGEYELHKYCINTSQTNLSNCEWKDASTNITETLPDYGNYYIHVVDKGGYVMHSNAIGKKYEYTQDFTFKKEGQLFTAPENGFYKFELWGASNIDSDGTSYYYGAYTSGNINLKKNEQFYIYTGEAGARNSTAQTFNGGGSANVGSYGATYNSYSPGAGATDIRLNNGNWNNFEGLKSRIMVAAGSSVGNCIQYENATCLYTPSGGGIQSDRTYPNPKYYSSGYGLGVTQTSGGCTNQNQLCGSFGTGGNGETYTYGYGSSGGGGGYYGGSGGMSEDWNGSGERYAAGGATGGSSFISGHTGCNAVSENSTYNNIIHTGTSYHYSGYVFTDTVMIDGNGFYWSNSKSAKAPMPNPQGGYYDLGHSGNGFARITYIGN